MTINLSSPNNPKISSTISILVLQPKDLTVLPLELVVLSHKLIPTTKKKSVKELQLLEISWVALETQQLLSNQEKIKMETLLTSPSMVDNSPLDYLASLAVLVAPSLWLIQASKRTLRLVLQSLKAFLVD